MASLLKRARRQSAVYWSQATARNDFGARTYADPVEIMCRWDDEVKQVKNPNGEVVTSNASVLVDRDMKPGDMLALGELDSSMTVPSDSGVNAIEIIAMSRIPPLRRGDTAYIAHL